MENSSDWEHRNLINELKQGRDLAKQLQIHLNKPNSSNEMREFLVHEILNSYDKAFSMLNYNTGITVETQSVGTAPIGMLESPQSLSWSPRSEDSDRDFKDHDNQDVSKKRKSMPRWTQQVQICQGTGLEGPLDDGFNWRKYGQKDILGAKYPRGYYRCTHRNAQGCLATKQVQRSDEDSTIFEITYRGTHTCTQASLLTPPSSPPPPQREPNPQSQETLLNFQTGLKVITDDLDTQENNFPPFHFPSGSNTMPQESVVMPCLVDNNFAGNFSPLYVSPATSSSNYFSLSPTRVSGYVGTHNVHGSDSELNEIISASTSATNSPIVGADIPFGHVEFGSNFTFDNSGFFS
ncbi:hypothetical protein LguiA_031836 [Lonicera macranthoides]